MYGTLVPSGGPGGGTKVSATVNTKVGPVTIGGAASGGKAGGKLSLKATPDSGRPPLAVTFAVSAPKVVQWRLDYGDGSFRTGFGRPPASVAHTYRREGDFRPRLSAISSATASTASTASASVSVHAAALVGLVPSPASG